MLVVVWKQRTTQHHVHSLRPNLYYHHFDSGFVVSDWMGSQWLNDRGTEGSETRGPYAIRNNTSAVQMLMVLVETRAMRLMPGVQLRPNTSNDFDFVRAGPAWWL